MNKKIALFPGSFDPFTKGHESVVEKAMELFDEIVIGIGVNVGKNYLFNTKNRLEHINTLYKQANNIRVATYTTLTVDFAKTINATHIIRGLRNVNDYTYEQSIAQMNLELSGIESVFFLTKPTYAAISSTIIREIFKTGGEIDKFVTNPSVLVK